MRKQDMGNQFSKKTRKKARSIQAQRIFRSRWFKSLVAMGSVVVFCTVYSLIIPAATLTEDQASADAGIVLEEAAPSEPQPVEEPAETPAPEPAPEPVQEEAPKEEPVVQAAAAVEEAPAAASSETVTETPAEAASTAASTEQSLNESAAAGSGSEEIKTENAETANTAAANETAPAEKTSGTATDETATEGTDAALTTEETTEEASTADSEESVEETTGKEEEVGTVSEIKGTSGNLEAVVRFAEGAGIPENATLAIYGGSADTGKVQDALWSGSMDSIEQSTITTDLSEYVSFAVKDVDGNDITPDSDCSIEISFGSEADLSDPGENKIKKYGTLVVGSDGNVSVTGTSLSTGDGHTYATFSGKLSGNTFGFAVTTADKKVNYLEGLSGKTSDGAVEASLTFGKDAKVPEGSTLTVESASVSESSVLDKLWGNYEGVEKDTVTADDVQFVKFVIRDKDGKEISPETKVSVKLTFHHEADLSSAAEGKVKKYNALAVSSDGTITLGSKALSAENGTTTASFADVSAKNSLGYAVSSADKKVIYATRLIGKSEDGTIEASLRLTEEAKIPEGSLLKVTPVTGESVQKTLLDNIWTDTSIIDPDTIELTDSGLAAVIITDKDGNALKPEADATLTLTFNKEADLKEAARKMVKRAKTVTMTEENVKLSDDGLSAAEGKTKVSYTGIVDGQTFGYAVSTAKQKTNFLEGKLTYEGEDYTIEVSVNKDNQIPEGSELKVKELDKDSEEFKKKLDQAAEAVQKDAEKKSSDDIETTIDDSSVRMFDITIQNEDGDEIQPNGDVSVSVQYKKAVKVSADAKMKAIHFDEKNEEVKVLTPETKADTSDTEKKVHEVKFDTNGFSVYAILGTEERTSSVEGKADTLTETLDDITFTASYDADAGLPDGTKLVVKAVDADDYSDATADALGDVTIVGEKYFDISFEYDGEPIEPKADVEVTITLSGDDRLTEGNAVKVVHFADGKDEAPEVLDAEVKGGKAAESESTESTASAAKPSLLKRAVKAVQSLTINSADDSTTDNGSDSVVKFKSDRFSVYGIVETEDTSKTTTYRTTFTFLNDDNQAYNFTLNKNPDSGTVTPDTNQQIVKDGSNILEVGTPTSTVDRTKKFLYWEVTSSTLSGLNEGDHIEDLAAYTVNMTGATSDAKVTLKAVYSDVVTVTYHNFDGAVVYVQEVEKGTTLEHLNENTTDNRHGADLQYTDNGKEKTFIGWAETADATTVLTSKQINENTDLYGIYAEGYWLYFDKNDGTDKEGADPTEATYTSPVFIPAGNVTSALQPIHPKRSGYRFDGWYKNAHGTGNRFSFNDTIITSDTTLYAKWTPKTVNYRVVYWQENPDDYGFSYYRSGTLTGTAGTTTNIESITLTDADGKKVDGFHPHSSTETDRKDKAHLDYTTKDVVIKGDGTTVVNVYFDREIYTLSFVSSRSGEWVQVTNENQIRGNYYYSDDAHAFYSYSEGRYNANSVRHYYNKGYTVYNRASSSSTTYATITGKYGSDIHDQWPSSPTSMWATTDGGNVFQSFIMTMPGENRTYYYVQRSGTTYRMNYMVQDLNQSGLPTNTFTEHHHDSPVGSQLLKTSTDDYYDITGFTVIFENSNSAGGLSSNSYKLRQDVVGNLNEGQSSSSVGSYFSQASGGTLYAYYARNRYKIDFTPNDGNNTADIKFTYYYQASIADAAPSDYVWGETTITAPNGEKRTFDGWYDNPDGLGHKYVFTDKTMPANNIHLYGKWVPTTYKVTFQPNGGTFASGDNPTEDRVTENIAYGSTISEDDLSEITRKGYELVGWFKQNADGTEELFNFSEQITSNIKVKAHWRKTGKYYVRYVNTSGEIPNGIQIQVDMTNYYTDNATVEAMGWPTGEGAVTVPTGYEFVGWSYQGKIYKPGETFTVDASKDVTEGKLTIDGEEKTVNFVTLTAVYTKIGTTYIFYDANSGGGTLTDIGDKVNDNYQRDIPLNKKTKLSGGAGFVLAGYKLVAWNTQKVPVGEGGSGLYSTTRYKLGDTYGVDGDKGNTLYAEWARVYVEVKFIKSGGTSTDNSPLAGAQFTLNNGGTGTDSSKTATSAVTTGLVSFKHNGDSVGNAVLASTTANSLTLTEVSTPEGYKKPDNATWTVTYDPQNATLQDGKYYVTGTITGVTDNTIINEPNTKNIIIKKVAEDGTTSLSGAEFKLTGGTDNTVPSNVTGMDSDGKVTVGINGAKIEGLVVGTTYTLTETKAPDGYIIKTAGTSLTVTNEGVTGGSGNVTTETSDGKTYYVITITNEAGKELPSTGGSGTLLYTIGGLAIISMAAFMYVYLLRRNKQFKG